MGKVSIAPISEGQTEAQEDSQDTELEVDSWPQGGSDMLGGRAHRKGTASPSLST